MIKAPTGVAARRAGTGLALAATLTLTTLGGAAAEPADATILGEGNPSAIPGQYVVVLNGAPAGLAPSPQASSSALAGQLTETYGGTVGHTYDHALRGFSVGIDAAGAERLAADPAVKYVQQSATVRGSDVQENPPSWGLDRVDQQGAELDDKYTYEATGEGVTVYDLDTGVNKEHPDFEGRAEYGPDFINDDDEAKDDQGHGTHTAGTAVGKTFGVAKQAKLVAIKILGADNTGPDAGIIKAVDWVTQNGTAPGVINMSLTSDAHPDQAMNDAVENASKAGFLTAAAAGNDGGDACLNSPASAPSALTAGSIDQGDGKSGFSSIGKCIDLFAPGGGITSASHSGNGNTTMSGTSMAAPHLAGAAALYFSLHKDATVQEAHDAIVGTATEGAVGNPGQDSPNKLLHTLGIK